MGDHRNGADGDDLVLPVPDGTVVTDADGDVLADLVGAGTTLRRRRRAAAAASATRRSPRPGARRPGFALLGEPGEARDVVLELKTVADVGLVGFPSAGKSSLVAAMSAARPKIADYPFTTLVPNLGVVEAGETRFTVADVPGLIPGASEGKGLGLEFLRHVERCAALVHVLDCATLEPGRDPVSDLDVIEAELAAYGGLDDRPRLVALNKVDVPEARELAEMVRADLEARGLQVFEVSAATHEGLRELSFAMAELVARRARAGAAAEPTRIVLRPRGRRRHRLHGHGRGRPATSSAATSPSAGSARPTSATTRPSATSPTGSPGSASRTRCATAGAEPGDEVVIGGGRRRSSSTGSRPSSAGAEHLAGSPRGSDQRLEGR